MDSVDVACVCIVLLRRKKIKQLRNYWVHLIISPRLLQGQFHILFEKLKLYNKNVFIMKLKADLCYGVLYTVQYRGYRDGS